MFSVHTTREKFEDATMIGHFGSVFEENSVRNHMAIVTSSFTNSPVFKMFSVHAKPTFLNSSVLKSVFERLRFRDGLVWTAGLTVEIKLGFSNFPSVVCTRR